MIALKLFSGIRNTECFRLTWGEIKAKQIRILAAFAKIGRYRTIKIHSNLAEWLKDRRGKPGELVFGVNPKTKDRKACWLWYFTPVWQKALALEEWPTNALRHTFGSHYYARTKSEPETAYEMGNSEGVVKRHYIDAVEDDDCKRYWWITPDTVEQWANLGTEGAAETRPEDFGDEEPVETGLLKGKWKARQRAS